VLEIREIHVTAAVVSDLRATRGLSSGDVHALARKVNVYEISYLSDGLRVRGYIVAPRRIAGKSPHVLFARGGFEDFSLITSERLFGDLALWASWGYVVAATNYRGSAGSEGRDEMGGDDVNDIVALKKLLCRSPYVDSALIGIIGHSRGAIMVHRLLASTRWLKAAVTIGGSTDLERSVEERPEMIKVYRRAFGGTRPEMRRRSGVHLAATFSKRCPILVLHGTADWRVSPYDSIDLSARLVARRVPHRLILYEGADHSLREHRSEGEREIRLWLARFLNVQRELPRMIPHGP
jgi:dipeptidyl aminopeptidase/acylaminoacyl peptidase